uniref:Uncharacterized protein n=1 Tax=Lepeophtheirus salmonis TaxID=72036 RepID=A0A0K2U3I5_LEPSM
MVQLQPSLDSRNCIKSQVLLICRYLSKKTMGFKMILTD